MAEATAVDADRRAHYRQIVRGRLLTVIACTALLTACGSDEPPLDRPATSAPAAPGSTAPASPRSPEVTVSSPDSRASASTPAQLRISSPDFRDDSPIPVRFTCDGANVSPALAWSGVPAGTAELALVVDDPDAPNGTFTHWVVVGIRPDVTGSEQGSPPSGGREVANDTGKSAYFGPCPPSGTHHYRFTVYALPRPLGPAAGDRLPDVLDAVRNSATAQAQLVGTYHR